MSPKAHPPKGLVVGIAFALALGAGGCSMDDVQFNGGIFDAVGLSDAAKAKSRSGDPKLAARAPLVVPPTLDNLPQPGTKPPPDPKLAEIKDPDAVKAASKEELERQQAAYCKVNYEDAMARGDETTALNAEGPLGQCRPSVLTAIKKWNSGDDGE
jgi:hypothetical protein